MHRGQARMAVEGPGEGHGVLVVLGDAQRQGLQSAAERVRRLRIEDAAEPALPVEAARQRAVA